MYIGAHLLGVHAAGHQRWCALSIAYVYTSFILRVHLVFRTFCTANDVHTYVILGVHYPCATTMHPVCTCYAPYKGVHYRRTMFAPGALRCVQSVHYCCTRCGKTNWGVHRYTFWGMHSMCTTLIRGALRVYTVRCKWGAQNIVCSHTRCICKGLVDSPMHCEIFRCALDLFPVHL